MFKKMLTTMGVGILLLSLTACSSYEAFELLELSNEVMEEVESAVMDLDMEISMGAGFGSITVPLNARMAVEHISTTDANISMEATMNLMGMSSNMNLYYRNGHLYADEDGFRERIPMSLAMAMDEIVGPFAISTDINENWIEEYSFEPTDDGHRLEFTLDGSALNQIMDSDFIEALVEEIADPGSHINHESVVMVIYIDEDYYQTSIELEMEATTTANHQQVEIAIDLTLDIVETGDDVTVSFPAWLDQPIGNAGGGATGGGNVDASGHALLGEWENGSGRILLFGIGSPDAIEFRADGTATITGGSRDGETTWAPASAGSITVGSATLSYRVSGNSLTLTDMANDDWSFDRAGGGSSSRDRDSDSSSSSRDRDSQSQIVGEWDYFGILWWTFNADGTGYENTVGDFTWTSSDGVVSITIGRETLRFEYEVTGNRLHLYGIGFDWDYEYTRR